MKSAGLLLIGSGLVIATAAATTEVLQQLTDVSIVTEYAFYSEDQRTLGRVRDDLENVNASSPTAALAGYYSALADYRLGLLSAAKHRGRSGDHLSQCTERLETVLESEPEFAEGHALRSACQGAKAEIQPLRAAVYRWQAGRSIERAIELEEKNPRVVLLDAVNLYRASGNDEEISASLDRFLQASVLFDQHGITEAGHPAWGHAEVWAYLGEVYLERGEFISARNALDQALVLAPDYVRARDLLNQLAAR